MSELVAGWSLVELACLLALVVVGVRLAPAIFIVVVSTVVVMGGYIVVAVCAGIDALDTYIISRKRGSR